jgi:hypothetical protein
MYTTEYSEYEEADDLISKYQYEGRKDQSVIVVTEDKDAKQTPGWLYNPRKETLTDCNGLGHIELITKISTSGKKSYKLEGHGRLWFYSQCVLGDKIDSYHPFPKVYTDYKVYNLLKDCKDDKEAWTVLAAEYKIHYDSISEWTDWQGITHKGTWVDILQTYVDVVHMRRWDLDRIDAKNVLIKYELL